MRNARLFGQACFSLLLIVFFGTPLANAQVNVTLPLLEGSVGQTVSVPVDLTDVELTTGFSSFSFEVSITGTGLVFEGHDVAGSLVEAWSPSSVASGGSLNRVGGFASVSDALTTSGTLIYIKIRIDSIDPDAKIELFNFKLNYSSAIINYAPDVPMTEFASGVDVDDEVTIPDAFVLEGNYPNPFNPSTNIQFDLKETSDVQVHVMDLLGREMMTVPSQSFAAGSNHTISVDAASLTSGIYIYRVIANSATNTYVGTGTMTLIK